MPINEAGLLQYRIDRGISYNRAVRAVNLSRTFYVDSPLVFPPSVRGFRMVGTAGARIVFGPGSGVLGTGTPGTQDQKLGPPLWTLVNWRDFVFEGFDIEFDLGIDRPDYNLPDTMAGKVGEVIRVIQDRNLPGISTNGMFRGLRIETSRKVAGVFRIGAPDSGVGHDSNNEWHKFIETDVNNYTQRAIVIEGTQSKEHEFRDCRFNGNDIGRVGVLNMSGSYHWYGGRCGGHDDVDFYRHWSNGDPISHTGFNGEGSRQLFRSARGGGGGVVSFEKFRWSSNRIRPDGVAINYDGRSPLVVGKGELGEASGYAGPVYIDVRRSPTQMVDIANLTLGENLVTQQERVLLFEPNNPHRIRCRNIESRNAEGASIMRLDLDMDLKRPPVVLPAA